MTHKAKALLAAKSGDLCVIPGTSKMNEENWLLRVVLQPPCMQRRACSVWVIHYTPCIHVMKCLKRVEMWGASTVEWTCLWSWPLTESMFWRTGRHLCCKECSDLLCIGRCYEWLYVSCVHMGLRRCWYMSSLISSPSYLWRRSSPLDTVLTEGSSVACHFGPHIPCDFSCAGVVIDHPASQRFSGYWWFKLWSWCLSGKHLYPLSHLPGPMPTSSHFKWRYCCE